MPKIGDPIDLAMLMHDGASDKHVRAHIYRDDNSELSGSPVSLSHISGGFYSSNSAVWPNSLYLNLVYKVFEDAGFTVVASDRLPGTETVYLEQSAQDIENLLSKITNVDFKTVLREEFMLTAKLSLENQMRATLVPNSEVVEMINVIEGTRAIVTDGINGSGSDQNFFKAWAYKDDNTLTLADSDDFDFSDFGGVNIDPVLDGDQTQFIRAGRAVNALNGMGLTAGTLIYLGPTPGELTEVAPLSGSIIVIGRAEPTNPDDTGAANDLFVEPQILG